MTLYRIPLSRIDFQGSFTITFPLEKEELFLSIKKIGLLYPPLIYKFQRRYRIISGKRRIFYLEKMKLKYVQARVMEVDKKQAFLLGLWDNISSRRLNPQERINALYGLRKISHLGWKEIISGGYCRLLGFPQNTHFLERLSELFPVPDKIKMFLANERFSFENCLKLKKLNSYELNIFLEIVENLGLGRNKVNDILDSYITLRKARNLNKKSFLRKMFKISLKSKNSPRRGFQDLKGFLEERTHPRFSKTKKRIRRMLSKIVDPRELRIEYPQNFEDKKLLFQFEAKSKKDFLYKRNILDSIAPAKIEKLFKTL